MTDNTLVQLFTKHFGFAPKEVIKLKGAGSNRQYFRLNSDNSTAIGVIGESIEENKSFISFAQHFKKQGLNVPELYSFSDDYLCYLQQDLGDTSLYDVIKSGSASGDFTNEQVDLCIKTIKALPDIQFRGAEGLDFNVCYPQPAFDRRTVMWDLNYFKYCYLKATGIPFLETKLEDDFQKLADQLLCDDTQTFLYRDFQTRNVMIKDGEPYFIDFQGGRHGPIHYDVASFVFQARAAFTPFIRQLLVNSYLESLSRYVNVDKAEFKSRLLLFTFFRTLQVLGAYGFRGNFEGKEQFKQSIPQAITNLHNLLEIGIANSLPYLKGILTQLVELNAQKSNADSQTTTQSPLIVTVYSFSFKKDIPADDSGNGGGYVFDCRGMDNPGRYDKYKQLTGLDKPVIDFLEQRGEITTFLNSIYQLADAHVSNYIQRDFTSLTLCFGCTGGQHRSVYSAQHTAEHIAKKFGVKVRLIHRERNITQNFNF